VNCRQTGIPRASAVFTFVFEVLEECSNQWRIEITEEELRWGFPEAFLGEAQQETKCIPIRSDRVGTRLALFQQAIGEEGLEEWGEVCHGSSPMAFSRR
jgi:hypothetical protein